MPDNLPFIASNPAIDEFNRANQIADQQEKNQLDTQGKQIANRAATFNLQQAQTEAPTRLRMLNANADVATTNAQYAPQEARAKIAEMTTNVARAHMDAFTRSLQLLDAGDVEGARATAARMGDQIPDAIVNNAQMRGAVKNVTATAQQLYPNRPRDQMAYIHAHISALAEQAQQQQPVNPQTAPYAQVPGAPQPPEMGGIKTGETERIMAAIHAEHPTWTQDQIIAAAHGRGGQEQIERERLAQQQAKVEIERSSDASPEAAAAILNKWRQYYGLQPPAPGSGTPATAPARPQTIPAGAAYSPSRNMWRDQQGNIYDATGRLVTPAQPAAPAAPTVSVPFSAQ